MRKVNSTSTRYPSAKNKSYSNFHESINKQVVEKNIVTDIGTSMAVSKSVPTVVTVAAIPVVATPVVMTGSGSSGPSIEDLHKLLKAQDERQRKQEEQLNHGQRN